MYGRRRVGKTRLLTEFAKDKSAIFHVSSEQSETVLMKSISHEVLSHYQMNRHFPDFTSWEAIFSFIGEKAETEKTLLILDELQYLAKSHSGILSILQNTIDHLLSTTKLFLVLCGSSISFMEHEILSHKSPLFGRRTGQMEVNPLDFFDASKFFPSYNATDCMKVYNVLGGIPQYLLQFSRNYSFDENMRVNLFEKSSYLYREPEFLIKQELKSPAVYLSIIEAITGEASRLNEISTKIRESTAKTSVYMRSLLELRIIKRLTPVGEKKSKRTIYRIADNLFDFYYRFMNPYISAIEQELGSLLYDNEISSQLPGYLGFTFEQVCKE